MSSEEEEWERRHVAAFRTHRGHSNCTVTGCTGSQPLMWVPTEAEVRAERQPRGRAIDFPLPEALVRIATGRVEAGRNAFARGLDHIHFAARPQTDQEETP